MYVVLIAFCVLLLLRLFFVSKYRARGSRGIVLAVRDEFGAWLLTVIVLLAVFALLWFSADFFGPFPQVHEW